MSEIIIKSDINKALYKILGNLSLIESWWHTENFHFDFNTPDEMYQSGEEGRKAVRDFVFIGTTQKLIKDE